MLTNQKLLLDGQWRLYYAENKQVQADLPQTAGLCEHLLQRLRYADVPAAVPGNFELDLQRAGIIDEPFYACNTILLQKYENLHLFYVTRFSADAADANTYLTFEGIDAISEIYVNGALLGKTDNMLIPFSFPAGGLIRPGENELVVHILPAFLVAREYPTPASSYGICDSLFIRKAPHMYGWDIMPRALSGGIWRSCYLEQRKPDRIDDVFVTTQSIDPAHDCASFRFLWNLTVSEDLLTDYRLQIEGACGESRFLWACDRLRHTGGYCVVEVPQAKLWYPKNYGDANLYDITVTLFFKDQAVFVYPVTAGLRTVELERTSYTDKEGNGEFVFRINGQKVFWQGTNWVPVDAYHSRDRERLPQILPMLNDLNCNCVRCWGGNVYEDDLFYDFCDRNGIMIWQDFAHACAVNPQDDGYCSRFFKEVEQVILRLRNHTSIVLWAGDNEVDLVQNGSYIKRDPNSNRLTREVIPRALQIHDYSRPYLPSSPYWDAEAFRVIRGESDKSVSEAHLWGPRDYFKGAFYGNPACHFASEIGYHGCPSPASLQKFIRPEQLWHWKKYPDDPERGGIAQDDWTCHAACIDTEDRDRNFYRIRLMSEQVKKLFVNFRRDEAAQGLFRFAMASQISQAEAKKFFIEHFRICKWRKTGIIWWNLMDGWPQISDAVVDYYGSKKLAYHYIKRSQAQLCMMFDEPKGDALPLYIVSDLQQDLPVSWRVTDVDTGCVIAEDHCTARANSACRIWQKPMEAGEKKFYLIEWSYTQNERQICGRNHYVTNAVDLDLDTYCVWMRKAGFDIEFHGFDR